MAVNAQHQLVLGEDDRRPAVVGDIGELVGLGRGVDGREDAARLQGAQRRDIELGRASEQAVDPIARLDAEAAE